MHRGVCKWTAVKVDGWYYTTCVTYVVVYVQSSDLCFDGCVTSCATLSHDPREYRTTVAYQENQC